MRKTAWILLLLFAFTIPWEYSLDLGGLLGNAARIAGLLVLLAAVPAVLQAGSMRTPGAFWWITLALFLWFCCSCFWTIDSAATLESIRGYFQEMMIVWLIWEFADTPADLRALLRATVAGSWVLALLTLAAFSSPEAIAAGQIRFAAYGQDPNEVARFLDLGFPLAALLVNCEQRWLPRSMALGFFPLGLVAVVLTASREGFLAAVVALVGSAILLMRGRARRVVAAAFVLPPFLAALWLIVPGATLARLATIPEQLQTGDLNQRFNIWSAGWSAFARRATSRHRRRHICRRRASFSHRHRAQHRALDRRQRRAMRVISGCYPFRARRSICSSHPRLLAAGAGYFAHRLGADLACRHRRREPHHVACSSP